MTDDIEQLLVGLFGAVTAVLYVNVWILLGQSGAMATALAVAQMILAAVLTIVTLIIAFDAYVLDENECRK